MFSVAFSRSEEPGPRVDSILEYLALQAIDSSNNHGQISAISSRGTSTSIIGSQGPPNDTLLNVLGVLDLLGADTLRSRRIEFDFQGLVVGKKFPHDPGSLADRSILVWDSTEDEHSPFDETCITYQPESPPGYNLGWFHQLDLHFQYPYSSLTNLLVAVRDAIQ